MALSEFDFDLPQELIALRPAVPRDASRLLVVNPSQQRAGTQVELVQGHLRDLPNFLKPADIMVFNNTKVLPAELHGIRKSRTLDAPDVPVKLTLIAPQSDGQWIALARPGRRLRPSDIIEIEHATETHRLRVLHKDEDGQFLIASDSMPLPQIMATCGSMPLPPYISGLRPVDQQDMSDYQTVYANVPGAVAAPTAGLHFTERLLSAIDSIGVRRVHATLHVGAGTFLPVKPEMLQTNQLHAEWCDLSEETAQAIMEARKQGGRIIAVGTTTLRVLETAADNDGVIHAFSGWTQLFIKPGYRFKTADILLTNFHLPKSTLFMLVCAFSGQDLMQNAYRTAIQAGYRFYSYGDVCLLFREPVLS